MVSASSALPLQSSSILLVSQTSIPGVPSSQESTTLPLKQDVAPLAAQAPSPQLVVVLT